MRPKRTLRLVLLVALPSPLRAAYNWSDCKNAVSQIRAGELTLGPVNNDTLDQYIYHGPITGLDPSFPRDQFLAVTYEGCRAICRNPIVFYDAHKALSLVTNWIFPLAILLSLPWESLHRDKISKTLIAAMNWLGSPQTALTATIFNFRQIRKSHSRAQMWATECGSHLYSATYFVLSCVNQFDSLHLVNDRGKPTQMLYALVHGLFRPLSSQDEDDVQLTRQFLLALAFELRMLRRRAVIPTLASLGVFLVAFIFSIVLAFADLGEDNSPFSLSFGLLMTWLPLLVVFTTVDRNPVSSERVGELLSRWLYNVEVAMRWSASVRPRDNPAKCEWWLTSTTIPRELKVREFIGQGRKIQFCGLPDAVLRATADVDFGAEDTDLGLVAQRVATKLNGRKPLSWFTVTGISIVLVWSAIMSAFVVSFKSPTVGLGCRTTAYLVFGGSSTIPWFIQFRKRPPRWAIWISYFCNALAILALLAVITYQVTGLASNCYCKSSVINAPYGLGGYMDFESPAFYRDHFDVLGYWAGAAVLGAALPTFAFVVALFWWLKCSHLWKADEGRQRNPYELQSIQANTTWLL